MDPSLHGREVYSTTSGSFVLSKACPWRQFQGAHCCGRGTVGKFLPGSFTISISGEPSLINKMGPALSNTNCWLAIAAILADRARSRLSFVRSSSFSKGQVRQSHLAPLACRGRPLMMDRISSWLGGVSRPHRTVSFHAFPSRAMAPRPFPRDRFLVPFVLLCRSCA